MTPREVKPSSTKVREMVSEGIHVMAADCSCGCGNQFIRFQVETSTGKFLQINKSEMDIICKEIKDVLIEKLALTPVKTVLDVDPDTAPEYDWR